MEITSCKDQHDIAEKAYTWCEKQIEELDVNSLYVPAGGTPILLYKLWEQRKPSYLKGLKLLQIDEVITGTQKGMFRKFLEEHLPSYIEQVEWITETPQQADLSLLGLGLNGHVAFHEPSVSADFAHGEVVLEESTKTRLEMNGEQKGLTYGLGHFLKSKAILMMVSGNGKKEIFEKFMTETKTFPATWLKEHPKLDVLCSILD